MAFEADAWGVDGGTTSARMARLQLQSATQGQQGIINIADLQVKALDTPGPAVTLTDGACVIVGQETPWQGSYYGYNLGDTQVSIAPNSSGATRYDLVYVRVEDPTFSGSEWDHDPATDPIFYPRVKQGVSAGTDRVPTGESGIPRALLTIPDGTTNITQTMITPLGSVLNPLTHTEQFSLQGIWDPGTDKVGNTIDSYEQFPSGAEWDIYIPNWASQAVVSFMFGGLQYIVTGGDPAGTTNHDARGLLRAQLGTLTTLDTGYWQQSGPSDSLEYTRQSPSGGSTLDIPAEMRGTTQTLQMQGKGTAGYRGSLEADGWSGLVVTVLFKMVPVTGTPDRSPS